MIDSKCLTTKEVARLCRVSDATVKRWEEAGLIKSERTSGGHRRFRAEEVARFQNEQKLGVKQKVGDESVITAQCRRRVKKEYSDSELFHSMIAGREEEVANIIINEFINEKPLCRIFDEMIAAQMQQIGELWFEGKLSVAQEHLATRATMSALHKLRSILPPVESSNKLLICCGIEGDFHELSTHLVQMIFERKGWEVLNFGANTPLFSLIDEVLHYQPQMLCISSTVIENIERFSRDYKSFLETMEKSKTSIILGGKAFDNETMKNRFPADFYPQNFTELSEIVSAQV